MIERNAERQKCIEAMAIAAHDKDVEIEITPRSWDDESERVRTFWIDVQASAFDSLHGLARVCAPEATEEMIIAGKHHDNMGCIAGQWRAMSAAGDLTNAPEQPT